MTKEYLTNEDIRMIQYFYLEKGDLTRWSQWEEKLPLIEKQFPGLVHVLRLIEGYEVMLREYIEGLDGRERKGGDDR